MLEFVSIVLSLSAVGLSATTAWLTLFQRGTVRMTQPTVIYFGPDAPARDLEIPRAKVYLRSLLYSTSKRAYRREHVRSPPPLRKQPNLQYLGTW
jgi:hypothetical protein